MKTTLFLVLDIFLHWCTPNKFTSWIWPVERWNSQPCHINSLTLPASININSAKCTTIFVLLDILETKKFTTCTSRDEVLIACQPMVNSQEIMASMIFLLNLITAFFILPMNDVILVWVIYWNACLCFYIETYNYLFLFQFENEALSNEQNKENILEFLRALMYQLNKNGYCSIRMGKG